MPFHNPEQIASNAVALNASIYDEAPPSFMETLGASYRSENLIGSSMANARMDVSTDEFYKVDPLYNVYDDIQGYEDFADRFERAYNQKAAGAIKANIDREQKDRETRAASGWVGVMTDMLMGVADPTILIPAGAYVKAGKVGYSVGRSALAVGLGAGAGVAVQEAGLQATQETRTARESLANIGGSMILGGIVGAAGSKFLSGAEWTRLGAKLEEELADDVPNPAEVSDIIVSRMQSAGSAAVDKIKLDDLGVGGPKVAESVARATAALKINPGVETMFSPSVKVREVYNQMVDNTVYTRMNMEGKTVGPSVENLVKQVQRGALAKWIKSNKELYKQAKKAGFEGTLRDFNIRVARAGRRADVDELGDEFVTRAAQQARQEIFDPLLERAIKNGQLPEDVKVTTAASYVTRMWNRQMLIGEEDRFRDIARKYFREQIMKVPEGDRPDFVSKADIDDYIEDVVSSVFDNLTGKGQGDVPEWLVPVQRGPLKERTFGIADELVEDFLENDMEMVLRRYTRTMGAEVELAEKFGRADMKDQFQEIRNEYRDLRKKAKTDKERAQLDTAENRDIQNLEAFRDLIRGTYRAADEGSNWSQLTRAALAWNYMRLLGGVTLTSIADTMRLLGVHGVRATMREALPALASNINAVRISKADARDLGAVVETVLQSRIATLADLRDPYRYGSAMDRYISNATNVFSKATGLSWWNDTMKSVTSVMTQNRMAKNAINWSSAGKREKAYMAYLGIDENMAGRISEQLQKHGVQEKGIWGANVGKWDDDLARRAWGAALNKDVDRTIVTKGVADQPLWTRTNFGKLVMQFKSFGLASHQRVLIAGLQERPQRLAEQMVFGTALGMMIGYLKYIERGNFEDAERLTQNPGLWIADGLDRTGIFTLPFEASNTAEKLGSPIGLVGVAQALAGDEDRGGQVSRYASRNKLGAVLGPSAGIFNDFTTIAEQLGKGDLKTSGANALIRQVPGATLPGVRTTIHMGIKPALQDLVE